MRKFLLLLAASLLTAQSVRADRSGMSFWVFKKDTLQAIMAKGKGLDDPTSNLGRKAECWGHFLGDSCDMYLVEESVQFRLTAKIEKGKMDWGLWLYRGGKNRSGGGRGSVALTEGWIFPPDWEEHEWVVLFKMFTTK